MEYKKLKQSEIANLISVSKQAIHNIIKGRRKPSPQLAKKLEQATGVSRLAWLYPDEFPNPYLKSSSSDHNNKPKNNKDFRHVD